MRFCCDVRTVERCMLKDEGDWVVLFEQVGWVVGGGNECKLCGGGRCKCELRWKTEGLVWKLSDSCQQHALH
jgi:hypothetical protein